MKKLIELIRLEALSIVIVVTGIVISMCFLFQASASVLTWTQATANAAWLARERHTSVEFNNKIWVIGGIGPNFNFRNDVWYSTDGANWTCATANAAWQARNGHTSVVFKNRMWVIGEAFSGGSGVNDVWYSTDGVTWTCATANAAWEERGTVSVVTSDGKMWIMGGRTPSFVKYRNDVWYSTDGVSWTCATANAAWPARARHTSVVTSDGKMWVMGGFDDISRNDVWYSTDGVSWTCATANAAWPRRMMHTSVVTSDGKMWVMGGAGATYLNDVWYSTDGMNWTLDGNAKWTVRYGHTSVVHQNRIWVIGGYDGGFTNDVWYTNPIAVELFDFSSIGRDRFIELFPNPFKEVVRIEYQVIGHNSEVADRVSLKIYDSSGQLVRVLIDEPQEPGRRVILWDSRDNNGKLVPSGIYFCSLITGDSKFTCKLLRIK